MNIWDILIGGLVALILILAIRRLIRNKKQGKCTCGCDGCPSGSLCRSRKSNTKGRA